MTSGDLLHRLQQLRVCLKTLGAGIFAGLSRSSIRRQKLAENLILLSVPHTIECLSQGALLAC